MDRLTIEDAELFAKQNQTTFGADKAVAIARQLADVMRENERLREFRACFGIASDRDGARVVQSTRGVIPSNNTRNQAMDDNLLVEHVAEKLGSTDQSARFMWPYMCEGDKDRYRGQARVAIAALKSYKHSLPVEEIAGFDDAPTKHSEAPPNPAGQAVLCPECGGPAPNHYQACAHNRAKTSGDNK